MHHRQTLLNIYFFFGCTQHCTWEILHSSISHWCGGGYLSRLELRRRVRCYQLLFFLPVEQERQKERNLSHLSELLLTAALFRKFLEALKYIKKGGKRLQEFISLQWYHPVCLLLLSFRLSCYSGSRKDKHGLIVFPLVVYLISAYHFSSGGKASI